MGTAYCYGVSKLLLVFNYMYLNDYPLTDFSQKNKVVFNEKQD